MKNIYFEEAPDEKEPFLYKDYKGKIFTKPQLYDKYGKILPFHIPINVYVVDYREPIKDGNWTYEINSAYPTGLPRLLKCISRSGNEMKVQGDWKRRISFPQSGLEMVKVVLTSDSELIKDHVEVVTDDFCEWLTKQDSLTYIETFKYRACTNCGEQNCDRFSCRGYIDEDRYLTIIPEMIVKEIISYYDGITIKQERV